MSLVQLQFNVQENASIFVCSKHQNLMYREAIICWLKDNDDKCCITMTT